VVMWAEKQIAAEKNYAVRSYLFIIFYSTGMYLSICPSLHLPIYLFILHLLETPWDTVCWGAALHASSIPGGVTGILHWPNPSGLTMSLGSSQPLTEKSIRNVLWWVKVAKA